MSRRRAHTHTYDTCECVPRTQRGRQTSLFFQSKKKKKSCRPLPVLPYDYTKRATHHHTENGRKHHTQTSTRNLLAYAPLQSGSDPQEIPVSTKSQRFGSGQLAGPSKTFSQDWYDIRKHKMRNQKMIRSSPPRQQSHRWTTCWGWGWCCSWNRSWWCYLPQRPRDPHVFLRAGLVFLAPAVRVGTCSAPRIQWTGETEEEVEGLQKKERKKKDFFF